MSQKKKITMSANKPSDTKNTPDKKTTKDRIQYVFGYIGVTIIALVLAFVLMRSIGNIGSRNNGYADAQTAVSELLSDISDVDKSGIKKAIYVNIKDYNNEVDKFYDAAKQNKGVINLGLDTAAYSESAWKTSDARKEVGLNAIADSTYINIRLNATKTLGDTTYDTISYYTAGVYKINNKWFVYSLSEDMSVILDCNSQTHGDGYMGTADLGGFIIDTEWSRADITAEEESKFMDVARYENSDGEITLGKLALTDMQNAVNQYKSICEKESCEHVTVVDSEISGLSAKTVVAYDLNTQTYIYVWLFKPPMSDGYVRTINLITQNPYKLYPCIKSYEY